MAPGRLPWTVLAAGACAAGMVACVPSYEFLGGDGGGGPSDAPTSPPGDGAPAVEAASETGPASDAGGPFFFETGTPNCWAAAQLADQGAAHIPEGTFPDGGWNSDPPASGSHYPIWAQFQEYDFPVPYGYVVHDMEHGAIVFFYRCPPGAPCADVQAALRAASASIPDDPLCTSPDGGGENPGIRVRTVMLPSESMSVLIAASAWDWQYRANCIDQPSLNAFAQAHYKQGLEGLCTPGTATFVDAGN